MTQRAFLTLALVSVLVGCPKGATRELTRAEVDILNRMQERLDENRQALDLALDDLMGIAAQAISDQHSLSLSLSKAQLLESMKSPWTNPDPQLSATQKEVAFYHLYALAEAEEEVRAARYRERQATLDEVGAAYNKLSALTSQMIESEKIILAHLEQPASARISAFLGEILVQARSLRQELAASSSPELVALSEDVAAAEAKLAQAKQALESTVRRVLEVER